MLTRKGKYGLKALVHLAGLPPGRLAFVTDIATAKNQADTSPQIGADFELVAPPAMQRRHAPLTDGIHAAARTQCLDNSNCSTNGLCCDPDSLGRIMVGARGWAAACEVFCRRTREARNAKKVVRFVLRSPEHRNAATISSPGDQRS
jgi:hypothetical protein